MQLYYLFEGEDHDARGGADDFIAGTLRADDNYANEWANGIPPGRNSEWRHLVAIEATGPRFVNRWVRFFTSTAAGGLTYTPWIDEDAPLPIPQPTRATFLGSMASPT